MARQRPLREVPSDYFDDLTLLVRPDAEGFKQPPKAVQMWMRTMAFTGWRLRRSRANIKVMEAIEEEELKRPLRITFREGAIAGVIRKSPHGGRVWVTQGKRTVPDKPTQLLKWLGQDAERAVTGIEIDPLIVTIPAVLNKVLRVIGSALGQKVPLPVTVRVDQQVLHEIAAERDDGVDPDSFFITTDHGQPTVYTKPE